MKNQYFVLQAEFKTGHLLNKDLSLFINGNDMNNVYEIFFHKTEAIDYAKKQQNENSEIEYWVRDLNDKIIFYISQKETKYYD